MSRGGCYVYIITIDDLKLSKVGISNSLGARLTQLATGSPFKMRLEATFWFPEREMAQEVEYAFHSVMAEHRRSGEWFALDAERAKLLMCMNICSALQARTNFDDDTLDMILGEIGVPAEFRDSAPIQ